MERTYGMHSRRRCDACSGVISAIRCSQVKQGAAMYLRLAMLGAILVATGVTTTAQDRRPQTMSLIDSDQKTAVEKSVRELRTGEVVSQFTATNKAVVTLVGNQHSVASVRGFSVLQDEPTSVAGGMRGPTPTDYFMVSLGTCQNVIFVRYAAL